MNKENSNENTAKKNKIPPIAIIRTAVQLVSFILVPALFILNYSCTSETASANGCALSDINITDNLHSYKPPFCERHRWGYEKVLSRID